MNTKIDIASKVSAARNALNASVADFEEKKTACQKVRQTYAEALERKAALTQKITDFEAQIEAATAEFNRSFRLRTMSTLLQSRRSWLVEMMLKQCLKRCRLCCRVLSEKFSS